MNDSLPYLTLSPQAGARTARDEWQKIAVKIFKVLVIFLKQFAGVLKDKKHNIKNS